MADLGRVAVERATDVRPVKPATALVLRQFNEDGLLAIVGREFRGEAAHPHCERGALLARGSGGTLSS